MDRVNWTCPGCSQAYSVPDAIGLTLCPKCKPTMAGDPEMEAFLNQKVSKRTLAIVAVVIFLLAIPLAIVWINADSVTSKASADAKNLQRKMDLQERDNNEKEMLALGMKHQPFEAGKDVILSDMGGNVTVCKSLRDFDELIERELKKDAIGVDQLSKENRAFLCPSETKAKFMSSERSAFEVRIASGTHYGKSGWVRKQDIHSH